MSIYLILNCRAMAKDSNNRIVHVLTTRLKVSV